MAYLIGGIVGGFLGVLLLAFILEFFAFKKQQPANRAIYTVGLAYVIASVLYGFGSADGGAFNWSGIALYFPGAVLAYLMFLKRYQKAWMETEGG